MGDALRKTSSLSNPIFFAINKGEGAEFKGFNIFCTKFSLEISEEKKKEGENPSRGAVVMLPRRFCDRFFAVLRSFFVVLRSSTG